MITTRKYVGNSQRTMTSEKNYGGMRVSKMRIISITIDEDLLEQLETFAIKYKLSRSSAIRLAVKKMLEEGGGNENDYN